MINNNILLLIIDMQNDFCLPEGALYVKGAEKDMTRLSKFIRKNSDRIKSIILTQDYHNVIDISHPSFWEDKNGEYPAPFTEITLKQVLGGKWKPRFQKEKAIEYIRKLEKNGEYRHTIWPEHCIIGSGGAAICDSVLEAVKDWSRKGNFYEVVTKGTNPLTEHFGALKANVPIPGSPETQINADLVKKLTAAGSIYIAGEARSHCVAATVRQITHTAALARKLHIIEDCMTDIAGFEKEADKVYDRAKSDGVKFVLSTEQISV
jgi:nicotinamidase-related amidase